MDLFPNSTKYPNLTHLGVRVSQERLDGDEHFRDGQSEGPVVLDGVYAYIAVTGHVWVEYLGEEAHHRGTQRVSGMGKEEFGYCDCSSCT